MRPEEFEQIAIEGGEPARELVIALLEQVSQIPLQAARIEELERRLSRNSSNSSKPPSSDEPKSRAERRRKARQAFKRSMRKSGGQPGHKGKTREPVAPERVDERLEHLPQVCGCGHTFDGSETQSGDPVIHQQYELPVIEPLVLEHLRIRLECPCCGKANLAELPKPALAGFGPRLDAHIAMLAGVMRLSRSDVRRVVEEVFGVPASMGAIDNAIMRMSDVLADPWAELQNAIRQAEVVHADETGWRLAGAQQWLWVAAASLVACFRIDPTRSQAAAKALLGEDFGGFVVSDRYAGYHFLDVLQQQLCWCHVIRQFVEISQRPDISGLRGEQLVKLARAVIAAHRVYLAEDHPAQWLAEELGPLRTSIRKVLEQCAAGRDVRTANFAAGLLGEYKALWTFADVPQAEIDPTNNVAERAVRHAVLMRKIQGGTRSDRGSRWVERIQSMRETCRLQGRSVLAWLVDAATAAHAGQPIPTLVPVPAIDSDP